MKKSNWLMLALFAALAAGLRSWENRVGFDEAGLPVRSLPGVALPVALLAAAVYFTVAARRLPAGRGTAGDLSACFRFQRNTAAVACAVAGAFLVMLGAAASLIRGTDTGPALLLPVCFAAAALCVLYTAFALYRGIGVHEAALLIPVAVLAVHLIFLYRADASDPVLAHIYVEILAVVMLTFSSLERAAFAFRNGSPRLWLPAGALSVILASAAAVTGGLSTAALLGGCALVETGFLASAAFDTSLP